MDDQKNFVLAMVLSAFVLIGYWVFVQQPLTEQARQNALEEQAAAEQVLITPPPALQTRESAVTNGARIQIDTASLSGSFLVTGSRFDDIQLKNYKQTIEKDSPSVILLTPEAADKSAYIFDNWTRLDGGSGINTPWRVVSGTQLSETTPIVLRHDGDGFSVERTIRVDDRYLITLDDVITNTSGGEISLVRKGASRQHGLPDDLTNFFILQEGPIAIVDGAIKKMKYKKLSKKRQLSEPGESGWAGLTDKYWLSAAIAPQGKPFTAQFNYRLLNDREVYEAGYEMAPLTLTPGASIASTGYMFAGAKDRGTLIKYQDEIGISEMERAIDWGVLRILTRPMTQALSFLGGTLGNFGLGIIALTTILKILLFPLFNKQYESQAKMKKLQPHLKKLQGRYKDDRVKLQQEMMALYRKEGANPAAGCLPIIPTIFIFFALYKSVFINVDMRHAPFFGYIRDLSAKDPVSILNGFGLLPWDAVPMPFLTLFAIGPLALLYGASMAAMYTLTPQMGTDPMQQKIFKWMPWIFMFILAPFPAGLLIYWVWNNVLSFIQQLIITRKFKVETPFDGFINKLTGKTVDTPAGPKD